MRYIWKVLESKNLCITAAVDDAYLEHAVLCQQFDMLEEDGVRLSSRSIYTSGLHLSENDLETNREVCTYFGAKGPHIRFFFFTNGRSKVENGAGNQSYKHEVGLLQRNFLDSEGGSGRVTIPAGDRMSYYLVRMSRDFYLNLVMGEHWVHQDPFYHYIARGIAENRPNDNLMVTDYMLHILDDLFNTENPNHNYYYVRLKLRELLFAIHQYRSDLHKLKTKNIPRVLLDKMEKIKAYLIVHFQNPPTIPELATLFMLDEKKLKETFKYIYGITINKYVTQLRMEKAKVLLMENYNVTEMALHLGYQSVSHFIKVFKTHYGTTPYQALKKYEAIKL